MRHKIKAGDFDFNFTGSHYSEKDAIENGFEKLTGKELKERIVNKTFFGDYPMGYKFVTDIYENGKVEGINHVGTQDTGNWMIDIEKDTLSIQWSNSWIDTTTHAYEVDGNIEFYDVSTGEWRTTFKENINLKKIIL